MTEQEVLHGPFSIELHKKTFMDYFEVMLDVDGVVHYAVPSHQEFLIQKAMERNHWTREQLIAACPPEMQGWFLEWLIQESGGYIPVWQKFVLNFSLNEQQILTLEQLKAAGLFLGNIPKGQHVKKNRKGR